MICLCLYGLQISGSPFYSMLLLPLAGDAGGRAGWSSEAPAAGRRRLLYMCT